ncbi:Uncharacterised protein [Vibrio cholerae]|nr:Uncharacterised protein [Vibrio cholerae]CSI29684.1 Uncharacterised protein [Vibrio cholerae]
MPNAISLTQGCAKVVEASQPFTIRLIKTCSKLNASAITMRSSGKVLISLICCRFALVCTNTNACSTTLLSRTGCNDSSLLFLRAKWRRLFTILPIRSVRFSIWSSDVAS